MRAEYEHSCEAKCSFRSHAYEEPSVYKREVYFMKKTHLRDTPDCSSIEVRSTSCQTRVVTPSSPPSASSGRPTPSIARPDWPWARNYSYRVVRALPIPNIQGSNTQSGWDPRVSGSTASTQSGYPGSQLTRATYIPKSQSSGSAGYGTIDGKHKTMDVHRKEPISPFLMSHVTTS